MEAEGTIINTLSADNIWCTFKLVLKLDNASLH